jgi:hypothetical protein
MRRLGANEAATAAVFAWDEPDPIGLMALDKAIKRFDSLIMAAPLSRGAVPESMPPAFRQASIPLKRIHGDSSLLPVVNRIPLPGIILGRENTSAGFQTLDSEPEARFPPLIARWDDRAVFSFALLAAIQRLGRSPDDLEIHLGEYLKLGPTDPIVPIDPYGRLAVELKPVAPTLRIPAEELIDAPEDLLPKDAPGPVILVDERGNAEPATRVFSKFLPSLISTLVSDQSLTPSRAYPRLNSKGELALLVSLSLILGFSSGLPRFARNISLLLIAGVLPAAQYIAAGTAGIWLPGMAAIAALAAAVLTAGAKPTPAAAVTVEPPAKPADVPADVPGRPKPPKPVPESPPKPRKRGKKRRR